MTVVSGDHSERDQRHRGRVGTERSRRCGRPRPARARRHRAGGCGDTIGGGTRSEELTAPGCISRRLLGDPPVRRDVALPPVARSRLVTVCTGRGADIDLAHPLDDGRGGAVLEIAGRHGGDPRARWPVVAATVRTARRWARRPRRRHPPAAPPASAAPSGATAPGSASRGLQPATWVARRWSGADGTGAVRGRRCPRLPTAVASDDRGDGDGPARRRPTPSAGRSRSVGRRPSRRRWPRGSVELGGTIETGMRVRSLDELDPSDVGHARRGSGCGRRPRR